MTKIELAKKIASTIVGIGTTKVVHSIIQNNVPTVKITDKVAVTGAAVVIGAMASDATSEYTNAKIDEAAAWWRENVKQS